MFTGIIKKVSTIEKVEEKKGNLAVRLRTPKPWKLSLGDSVSVMGICSTVSKKGQNWFEVEYMSETLKKTTAAHFEKGMPVNVEQSLRMKDYIHGHLVSGHVDGRGKVYSIKRLSGSVEITVSVPKSLMKFVVHKGSVAIDGVSLTVTAVFPSRFTVALTSYTIQNTTLGYLSEGDEVNIETDMFAKHVYRLLTFQN